MGLAKTTALVTRLCIKLQQKGTSTNDDDSVRLYFYLRQELRKYMPKKLGNPL